MVDELENYAGGEVGAHFGGVAVVDVGMEPGKLGAGALPSFADGKQGDGRGGVDLVVVLEELGGEVPLVGARPVFEEEG